MNRYYELLKNNIIDFDKLMVDKYYLLGLNEIDAIILIKLNNLIKQGKRLLSTCEIVPHMSISEETCSKRIVELVNEGFITLELSSIDAKETFNMDETYKRLSYALDLDDEKKEVVEHDNKVKSTIKTLEAEMNKILSPLELEMVNRWFLEYNYSYEEIEEAIFEALKNKTRGVKYIDRFLYNRNKKVVNSNQDGQDIMELFSRVYANNR